MPIAAIYARVSSDKQREERTIASQTAALIGFARSRGYQVPTEWVFEDEGYSGASLVRPGLERVRDLAAEGQIEAVLVYAPDRLSRKYAYQILLIEELARHGVDTVFMQAPQTATAEDQLLVQFQGMIAEYERAQILERSRRGKRHRARQGQVNVLSGAPYGYRYVRKSDDAAARYEIIHAEADIVRVVYNQYVGAGMSIGAITRQLNERGVPTRKQISRWERTTVWAILRNPAYKGTACFGKTETAPRQRITRSLRLRGGVGARDSAHRERPRSEWIEIAVPVLIDEDTFARAQELLTQNKQLAPRRTIAPSIVQGLVSCSKCGYALSRTSTRSSARNIHYYRCLGSDAWRHLGGPVCDSRPVRQDLLDHVVWNEIVRLLEDPSLIQCELDRRLSAARTSDPTKQREKALEREVTRTRKAIDRLLTAYQEELLSLDELRRRMPELRQREHALQTELNSILDQISDRAVFLRLAETLSDFLSRLRSSADTLDIQERQRIVRLVVRDILVGDETIVIRHSIPLSSMTPSGDGGAQSKSAARPAPGGRSYLLRSGSKRPALRRAPGPLDDRLPIDDAGVQVGPDQPDHSGVRDFPAQAIDQDVVVHSVEELLQVHIHDDPPPGLHEGLCRQDSVVGASARSKAVAVDAEGWIKDRLKNLQECLLDQAVRHRRDAEFALATSRLRNHHATHRVWPVRPLQQAVADGGPVGFQQRGGLVDVQPVHARRSLVGSHPLHRQQQVLSRQDRCQQPRPCVVRGPSRAFGFVETGGLTGFTRFPLLPPGSLRLLTPGLAHRRGNSTLSRSALRSRTACRYYGLG
jgi:site-specific DNA recombinase